MLEVNDFNAIRISLASPEQIKQWSYGEVTKPETINYRTLKPEKDGLFCEKIFGPTKDWECYCGKYKRVRYKGIVCDKCGVEVARAKVRRERMGHIELAAPVSHIWFVKGTPSRVGLLLDVSPRSLERVLYFAQYIIVDVDEDERSRLLGEIEQGNTSRIAEIQEEANARFAEISTALDAKREELKSRQDATHDALESRLAGEITALNVEVTALRERLQGLLGQAAPEDISFGDLPLVHQDAAVNRDTLERLDESARDRLDSVERAIRADQASNAARIEAEIDLLRHQSEQEISRVQRDSEEKIAGLRADIEAQKIEVEEVKPLQLLNEGRYRELHDRYPLLFRAGMGAESVREIVVRTDLDVLADSLRQEIRQSSSSGQRRKKATKRLRVVEAFRKSGNRPEWMILTTLPVLPPDLRPMVQLDGGRFATSDLNDLYRRVINRNNRLKRLIELGAPEIIIRNEKRMLQEAVDSLIDNGRRGRAVSGSSNHKLKSLSDMLKGKQGRFRQNLLGKRVDYSGRSVIIVGPTLKLHQCGLPKKMALELFKPFVMRRLVEKGFAHNIKSAKRIVERVKPEVWDILEEVIKGHPVLLNRAPTLHRLGIQAFEPILIEGSAIQLHPLVCSAFGADFDGDQMAVHVPLSTQAKQEAHDLMLASKNLLSPASGEPTVAPTLDMVLGCYYMTTLDPRVAGVGKEFSSPDDAKLAHDLGIVDLQAPVRVRMALNGNEPEWVETSVGRIIFNDALPEGLRFKNETMDRKALRKVVGECYNLYGTDMTAEVVNEIKDVGFKFATRSGITISVSDLAIPANRRALLAEADGKITDIARQYRRGLITDDERYTQAVDVWTETTEAVTKEVSNALNKYGPIYMMTNSGAKGNITQLRQMSGMRGLMSAPNGKIIELPIRSSFREGLSVLEYFISTHGARKGLADTAIRTADSGYLTRRLIDVAQDTIVYDEDCDTTQGIYIEEKLEGGMIVPTRDRIAGRLAASDLIDHQTGEFVVERNGEIDEETADRIVEVLRAPDREDRRVHVRSPLTCLSRHGICRRCYGRSLGRGRPVAIGEAVGIIAAESIGEPGTQLTMRTFHTGGIAGADITTGLPRVEELFEARVPKGLATIAEIDGVISISRAEDLRRVKITSAEVYRDEYPLPEGAIVLASPGQSVDMDAVLARTADGEDILSRMTGLVEIEEDRVVIVYEDRDEREYQVSATAQVKVENGQRVKAGDLLTEGAANPQDVLRVMGREAVQLYLVSEVQKVYRSQGVSISDKHIEIIVRQMLRKVRVDTPGDTEMLPGELVDRFTYEEVNAKVLAEGGEPATAQTVLLGVTKASLNTESFLAAASFQETTRVLTEAAIQGMVDNLRGLKENVIIGKLIPAGTGLEKRKELAAKKAAGLLAELELLPSESIEEAEEARRLAAELTGVEREKGEEEEEIAGLAAELRRELEQSDEDEGALPDLAEADEEE